MITDDIGAYMQTLGLGTVGTDIFLGGVPSSPTACVTLFQRGGYVPMQIQNPGYGIERPELHIIVRSGEYNLAMEKANDIMVALHMVGEITINTHRYLYLRCLSSPTYLYADYSNKPPHHYVSVDFVVYKEFE